MLMVSATYLKYIHFVIDVLAYIYVLHLL